MMFGCTQEFRHVFSLDRMLLCLLACILFLSADSWGRGCSWQTNGYTSPEISGMCSNADWCALNTPGPAACYYSGIATGQTRLGQSLSCQPYYQKWSCEYQTQCCTDQCAADSVNCNGTWYPETCTCLGDECREDRESCESLGGRFVGTTDPIDQCCKGTCDLCESPSSQQKFRDRVTTPCCNAGHAPPPMGQMCAGNHLASGCGVTVSDYCTEAMPCYCLEPGDPGFLTARAMYCNVGSSSSAGSSSSGGSSSSDGGSSSSGGGSSGGGSSGSGEDWEYDYRDSLHKIIVNTGETAEGVRELVFCFTLGDCKTDLTYTNSLLSRSIHVDSLIYEFIKDRMDSSVKLDQTQIDILRELAKKGLPGDSTLWEKTDSSTEAIVNAFGESVDSTRLFMARIADSLGVSTDSIIKHLDSIWQRLDPDVQDSILKYQKYATDNFDSVLYGTGKGFSLIDSLIDTSVKYFKDVVTAIDTMSMNLELGDSLYDSLHNVIDGIYFIPNGVGIALGYGDTATSTLRGDLQGIRIGIDSIFANVSGLTFGVYDSLGKMIGGIDAMGNYIGDSIHGLRGDVDRLGGKLGDSLGSLHGSADGIRGAVDGLGDSMSGWWNGNGKGGLDTSGHGVGGAGLDSVLNGTSLYGDSAGVSHIVNAGINDPSLHFGAGGVFDTSGIVGSGSDVDTTGDDTLYALPSIDSIKAALENSIQEDYDSAEIKYRAYFDTLKDEMQLIDWDSVILSPLAQKVPNTNTCPEECFAVTSQGAPSTIGSIPFSMGSFDLNFGLCTSWGVLGGMNVLMFIRLLLRLVVALTCVYIGAWFIAGKK